MQFQRVKNQYIFSPQPRPRRRIGWVTLCVIAVIGAFYAYRSVGTESALTALPVPSHVKERLAAALETHLNQSSFPSEIEVKLDDTTTKADVIYTLDWDSQGYMEKMFRT